MEHISKIKELALGLKSKTQVNSITPEVVGELHMKTLEYIEGVELNQNSMGIRASYETTEKLLADLEPVGWNGKALRLGQLAVALNCGDLYAWHTDGVWEKVGNVSVMNAQHVRLGGVINLADVESVKAAQTDLPDTNTITLYIVGDGNGVVPSSTPSVRVPETVARRLQLASPNGTVQALISTLTKDVAISGFGVNVGDLIALTRVKVKVADLGKAIGVNLSLLGDTEIEMYQYKIISTNDAKPYGYEDIAEGVAGLMSAWDKTEVNKIPNLLPRADQLPSRWAGNMNNALQTGVYPWCTLGRPTGSTGAYTCIVKRTSTNDGIYDTIEQTAYGRETELGQVWKRIIFEKSDGTDTQYNEWVRIDVGELHNFAKNVETFAKNVDNNLKQVGQDVEKLQEQIDSNHGEVGAVIEELDAAISNNTERIDNVVQTIAKTCLDVSSLFVANGTMNEPPDVFAKSVLHANGSTVRCLSHSNDLVVLERSVITYFGSGMTARRDCAIVQRTGAVSVKTSEIRTKEYDLP